MTQILLGSLLLSAIHALIPNHWIPLVAIGRAEGWRRSETLAVTAITGLAHVTSTILIGIVAGLLGYELSTRYSSLTAIMAPLILIGLGVVNIVRKQSITPTPSVIPGLAPTQPIAETTASLVTPTIPPVVTLEPTPTSTPTETPVPVVPSELLPGEYARVIDTGGSGVSVRAGPGTNNARLTVAPEDSVILVVDGPRNDENLEGYTWWLVRAPDETEGWVVQDYLEPSLSPEAEEE